MKNNELNRSADNGEESLPAENGARVDDAMIERLRQSTRMAANEEWLRRRIDHAVPETLVADVQKRVRESVAVEAAPKTHAERRVNWVLRTGVLGAMAAALAIMVIGRESVPESPIGQSQNQLAGPVLSGETPYLETFVEYTEDEFSEELAAVDQLVLELESGWAGTSTSDEVFGLDDEDGFGEVETETADG